VTLQSKLEALVEDARAHGHSMVDCAALERLLEHHNEILRPDLLNPQETLT
jgi:hypothetical protein